MQPNLTPYPEDEYLNDYDNRDHPAEFCWNPLCGCRKQRKEYLDKQIQAGVLTTEEKERILQGKAV